MKVIKGFKQATSTLLKNRGLNLDDISDEMKLNIQKLFGKSLSPMQVVEYILNEVRSHGDDALIELTRKLDGGNLSKIQMPNEISLLSYSQPWNQLPIVFRPSMNPVELTLGLILIKDWEHW